MRILLGEAVGDWDAQRRVVTPEFPGIDEVVIGQPRCVLTNTREQTLVDLLPSRTCDRVLAYLSNLPQRQTVRWATMDMWRPYRDAVRPALPKARIVVDKFHVLRMANAGLHTVRKHVRTILSPRIDAP